MYRPAVSTNPRSPRKINVADHIWDAFESMADSMGADRDGLINQAMFMFARLNGFLETRGGGAVTPEHRAAPALSAVPEPFSRREPNTRHEGGPRRTRSESSLQARGESSLSHGVPGGEPSMRSHPGTAAPSRLDDDPDRREVAERVLETAAELERLIKGKNERSDSGQHEDSGLDDLEGDAEGSAGTGRQLYLMAEGGELDKISKDRFVIGRGKHCDFVINSGKVSREHAVITRDGGEYFIEDLGSSNGTWFNKQRIKRRKIEDGDEYFICSEKIKLVMR